MTAEATGILGGIGQGQVGIRKEAWMGGREENARNFTQHKFLFARSYRILF